MEREYFIADIGYNWAIGGDRKQRALDLIELAVHAGANVVEFPVFDRLYRDARSQSLVEPYRLPQEWVPELKERTNELGAMFSLCLHDPIDLPADCYSVYSYDINVTPLLKFLSEKDGPIFLGCGSASYPEIDDAIEILRPGEETPEDIFLIHHAAGNEPQHLRLKQVLEMGQEFFPLYVGFQTEVVNPALVSAVALYWAKAVKVKVKGNDNKGLDGPISYSPGAFRELVEGFKKFQEAVDCGCEMPLPDVAAKEQYRRDPSDWLRPVRGNDE